MQRRKEVDSALSDACVQKSDENGSIHTGAKALDDLDL